MTDLTKLPIFPAASLLTLVEVIADFSLKNPKDGMLLGVAGYNALAFLLKKLLKNNDISKINLLWNSMTNVTHLYLGHIWYNEKLNENEVIGVVLIMTGMGLLYLAK